MKKPALLTITLILLTLGSISVVSSASRTQTIISPTKTLAQTQTDLSGINVGVYNAYEDYVPSRVNESKTAIVNMLEWMNATVRVFNTTEIINGALWACEVLVIPEGLGPNLEQLLTEEGLQAIREWVAAGGSYIGVRGSAAMAVQYSYFEGSSTEFNLALINGTSYEVEDLGFATITNVTINRECTGPDLSDMPEQMSVFFQTGRYILPNEGQELIYIANYTHSNLPAMVASYYEEGTVFISSPHFEYEENGDRDGTEYRDMYDDPDSEWPFMLTITQWLIDSSPTVCNVTEWQITPTTTSSSPTPTTSDFPMELVLVGGGLGIVVVVAVLVYVKKR
ncbi:MAG: hypothetical protein ThorAB25_22510 [Candidatus Thorarchaeota archaeon AB_25]|nr:MAG: hypothetical protein ThorAB25_22510 [Candidatus Thorarchaeota archaeon AB_25]